MFGKQKPRIVNVGGQSIALEPKPSKLGLAFRKKPKTPSFFDTKAQKPQDQVQPKPAMAMPQQKAQMQGPVAAGKGSKWKHYVEGMAAKHKGLEAALREQGIKSSVFEFVQRMIIASVMVAIAIAVAMIILFIKIGLSTVSSVVFGAMLGIAIFYVALGSFLNFPSQKGKKSAKNVERDILFAARDMIISLRSGMPLYNAITSVSTGYGDASKEFAKIVERVQLNMPLEEAIDATIAETKSESFRRIMLQASVSIKAGADVISALQSVIDMLTQERVIELRRYGQRLNAIAMFYMLFGIILPSMGIAVVTILTTFISIFTITTTTLYAALVGIFFLQIIFLKLITGSRPTFSM
ncbi:MAG: type II secretion system F family protein [Candidatus Micrarchaeia archaeon]